MSEPDKKHVILIGDVPNMEIIEQHLAKLGIPTIKQSVDSALEMLLPAPCKAGDPAPVTNLYVIGNDIPDVERERLVEWLREEGGGPYIYVRTPNRARQIGTLPFHYIEPNQPVEQTVGLLVRYLENL